MTTTPEIATRTFKGQIALPKSNRLALWLFHECRAGKLRKVAVAPEDK